MRKEIYSFLISYFFLDVGIKAFESIKSTSTTIYFERTIYFTYFKNNRFSFFFTNLIRLHSEAIFHEIKSSDMNQ